MPLEGGGACAVAKVDWVHCPRERVTAPRQAMSCMHQASRGPGVGEASFAEPSMPGWGAMGGLPDGRPHGPTVCIWRGKGAGKQQSACGPGLPRFLCWH